MQPRLRHKTLDRQVTKNLEFNKLHFYLHKMKGLEIRFPMIPLLLSTVSSKITKLEFFSYLIFLFFFIKKSVEFSVKFKSHDLVSESRNNQDGAHDKPAFAFQSGFQSVPSIHLEKIYDL